LDESTLAKVSELVAVIIDQRVEEEVNDLSTKVQSFIRGNIEKLKEQRIFETQNPYAILANQFSVDIEMFGNTLFYPGRLVYINPAESLGGSGRPWQNGSVYQIMGLGGYHQIRKVSNVISDGVFKTSLEADFMSSGSPPIKRRATKSK